MEVKDELFDEEGVYDSENEEHAQESKSYLGKSTEKHVEKAEPMKIPERERVVQRPNRCRPMVGSRIDDVFWKPAAEAIFMGCNDYLMNDEELRENIKKAKVLDAVFRKLQGKRKALMGIIRECIESENENCHKLAKSWDRKLPIRLNPLSRPPMALPAAFSTPRLTRTHSIRPFDFSVPPPIASGVLRRPSFAPTPHLISPFSVQPPPANVYFPMATGRSAIRSGFGVGAVNAAAFSTPPPGLLSHVGIATNRLSAGRERSQPVPPSLPPPPPFLQMKNTLSTLSLSSSTETKPTKQAPRLSFNIKRPSFSPVDGGASKG